MSNAQNDALEEIIHDAEIVESPSEESTSPVPQEEENVRLMDFAEAITEATSGKRIRRMAWPEGECGYFTKYSDGELLTIVKDGKEFIWKLSKGDTCEEDWTSF